MNATREPVAVLLVFGDQAELTTPTRSAENPLCVPAADITADTPPASPGAAPHENDKGRSSST